MTQQDLEYRKTHAVVPQLDFMNGGHDNIVESIFYRTQFFTQGLVPTLALK